MIIKKFETEEDFLDFLRENRDKVLMHELRHSIFIYYLDKFDNLTEEKYVKTLSGVPVLDNTDCVEYGSIINIITDTDFGVGTFDAWAIRGSVINTIDKYLSNDFLGDWDDFLDLYNECCREIGNEDDCIYKIDDIDEYYIMEGKSVYDILYDFSGNFNISDKYYGLDTNGNWCSFNNPLPHIRFTVEEMTDIICDNWNKGFGDTFRRKFTKGE